jgi:hypothetical protein
MTAKYDEKTTNLGFAAEKADIKIYKGGALPTETSSRISKGIRSSCRNIDDI